MLELGCEPDNISVAAPATRPVVPRARIRSCRLPTWSPVVTVRAKGDVGAIHRARRPPGLLRGRDLRGRPGALRWPRADKPRGACDPGQQPRRRRSGGAGGDRQRAGDRAATGAARGAGRGGDPDGAAGDHRGQGQDRPARRAHTRATARRRAAARLLVAGRADSRVAPASGAPRAAGAPAHAHQERGARGADAHAQRAARR